MCPNTLYARVGGIPVGELNMLEREFLRMIDWRLTVSTFSTLTTFPPPNNMDTMLPLLRIVHSRSPPRILHQLGQDPQLQQIHDTRSSFLRCLLR